MIGNTPEAVSGVVVSESGVTIVPDPTRAIARLFVPGREDTGPGDSRAVPVIERILQLDECDVEASMRDIDERFSHRHRDLHAVFADHAAMVTSRMDPTAQLSDARLLLVGASFTHEYTTEGASICNPSVVAHPVQEGDGDVRFVLSVRGIGEGHRSSIGFRTGTLSAAGAVSVDAPGRFPVAAVGTAGLNHQAVFHTKLAELDDDRENASFVLDPLPPRFSDLDLDKRIEMLEADVATRKLTSTTITNLRGLAGASYMVEFPAHTEISERILWPHAPAERQGMEDARFVRFVAEDHSVTYYATYTAYDGVNIAQHLLETADFVTFAASPMAGGAAVGKGLALFPRMVHGRYAALSRSDRETNGVAFSDHLHCWPSAEPIQYPTRSWELLQLGNCGSPIETASGWLVLTHGVGPLRTYSLGAILLDIDEPQRVIASAARPIIGPGHDRRDGYVPNVIYTCGALAHGDVLMLPYAIGDQSISIATLSIGELLDSMDTVN